MTTVFTVNAFTDSPDGGNPAGVVLQTEGLTEEDMKAIAAKVGFSETAFVFPSSKANFKVRFFTPADEVDLCGHATIATFHLLLERKMLSPGRYTQETKAGVMTLDITESKNIFMTQNRPVFSETPEPELIYDSLGVSVNDGHEHLIPQVVSTGLRDVIVPVKDLKTLLAIQPDFEKISQISKQLNVIGYHLFCLETMFDSTAHCRNLAPLYDIPEEAATGTASGALSCYLYQYGAISHIQAQNLVYEQGYSMKRPSQIQASLTVEEGHISQVKVGGRAYTTGNLEVCYSL